MEDGGLPDPVLPPAPAEVLPDEQGGAQVLLRGLPGAQPVQPAHAVHSVDWYHPVAAELPGQTALPDGADRHAAAGRAARRAPSRRAGPRSPASHGCSPSSTQLLEVNQRYAVIREEQARDFTLAWPVLRACVRRLGEHLVAAGVIDQTPTTCSSAPATRSRRAWPAEPDR